MRAACSCCLMAAISIAGSAGFAQDCTASRLDELKPLLRIEWRLGPDYPMGIQDAALGVLEGTVVSAGGFTRHPLEIVKQHPDAFGGEASGFTGLTFAIDAASQNGKWERIADMPGPPRQGAAVAVVNGAMYIAGGINYDEPFTYRDTYRLLKRDGRWVWDALASCQLPWPVYGASTSTAVVGERIYLLGAADFFQAPGAEGNDFHSEAGRDGSPAGRALLVLDTARLEEGWKRLTDCPGVPQFDCAVAAAGGQIYRLGGIFGPLRKQDAPYYNAIDSWRYDPAGDRWTRLRDMPHGANRRALVYDDRYILLIAGYKYAKTWNLDGTVTSVYTDEEKTRDWTSFFEKTVLVYDTKTETLGTGDPLLEKTSLPCADIAGTTMYCLGGEGGPRLWHPATLQIGRIVDAHGVDAAP